MKEVNIIIGLQYGDEGKGKVSLAYTDWYPENSVLVCKWNGGPNAGHTVYRDDGSKVVARHLPGACLSKSVGAIYLGPNCVIDCEKFIAEVASIDIELWRKIIIHSRATCITPEHVEADCDKNTHLGTTKNGIGPAYAASISREGTSALAALICMQKQFPSPSLFEAFVANNSTGIDPFDRYEYVVAEGSQATMLDNLLGSYPYVTSSQCIAPSFYSSFGLGYLLTDNSVKKRVIGVMKPYTTRVGAGLLSRELVCDNALDKFITLAGEYGSVTKRKRRIAPLLFNELEYAIKVNGCTDIVITKADLLTAFCAVYPNGFNDFIELSSLLKVDVNVRYSTGPLKNDWSEPLNIEDYLLY